MGDVKIKRGEAKVTEIKYWLWLSLSSHLPPRAKTVLLEHYGSPEAMFFAPVGEITSLLGNNAEGADTLEKRDLDAAMRIIDKCASRGIRMISRDDGEYPERLRNIYAPPSVIYVKGSLEGIDEKPAIAVIGTRKASPYGLKMSKKLGFEIAQCGGTVISGLTAGIDAAGAEGALLADGECIGVLGVPHDSAKGRLYEEVAHRGALISEYPPGTRPNKYFFRARNRITAGLSAGVAVIEAPQQSGTRLFVDEAVSQGKEIFVVPGNADSDNCAGSNAMLKDGAKAVTCGWDIMSEFYERYPDRVKMSDAKMPDTRSAPDDPREEKPKRERKPTKTVIDKQNEADYIDIKKQLEGLSETQMSLISAIDRPSVHVDEIIEKTGLKPAKVLGELTMLQLKGFVKQESGKRFTLNIRTK